MHEASIAAPLLKIVLQELSRHNGDGGLTISEIHIRTGLLMGIEPVTLQGCFSLMAEGTRASGASLVLEAEPMRGLCENCGEEVSTVEQTFYCPLCGSGKVRWQGGNELYIRSLRVRSSS